MNKRASAIAVLLLSTIITAVVVRACADDVIYRTRSEFNTIIVTEDNRGVRTLRFEDGGARQSVVKLDDPDYIALPYAKAMHAGLAVCDHPQRVLVVGLGGGTIPQFLRRHFPRMQIDVVELDPAVIRVAKRYFGFREDNMMRAYAEDGRRFIERSEPVYDVIFLDAYSADSVPYSLTTREFLQAAREALTPGGVVASNVWSSRSNQLYNPMIRTYQEVFDRVAIVDVQDVGNRIVIAVPRTQIPAKSGLIAKSRAMGTQARFPFDLGNLVEYGYQALDEPDPVGKVLTDH